MTGNDVEMQPEEDQLEGSGNSPKRCAACKYLRRRCAQDCALAPYFPASHPHRCACVHRVFGASNVARILQVCTSQPSARSSVSCLLLVRICMAEDSHW
jgi:hypothetical protein